MGAQFEGFHCCCDGLLLLRLPQPEMEWLYNPWNGAAHESGSNFLKRQKQRKIILLCQIYDTLPRSQEKLLQKVSVLTLSSLIFPAHQSDQPPQLLHHHQSNLIEIIVHRLANLVIHVPPTHPKSQLLQHVINFRGRNINLSLLAHLKHSVILGGC